jgi:hypothetical protein
LVARTVNNDGYEESLLRSHVVRTFDGEFPFVPKVTLKPLLRVLGNNRDKEDTIVDLVPDLLVPGISAPQLALVEEDLDAGSAQRLSNLSGCLRIL